MNNSTRLAVSLALSLGPVSASAQDALTRLSPALPHHVERFGESLAISGEMLAVGAPFHNIVGGDHPGSVRVYRRTSPTGWTLIQKINSTQPTEYGQFGRGVALDGDVLVAHGPFEVRILEWNGAVWTPSLDLTFPSNSVGDVAVDGDTVAIGLSSENVQIYRKVGGAWSLEQTLVVPGHGSVFFGQAVGLSGDTLAVGALTYPSPQGSTGAVLVYDRVATTWTQAATLIPSDGVGIEYFGETLDIDGDELIVGASRAVGISGPDVGAAYVYRRAGGTWTEEQKLIGDKFTTFDEFAVDVAVQDGYALVGSKRLGWLKGAFGFRFDGSAWVEDRWLTPSNPQFSDGFGWHVALDGSLLAVGAAHSDISGYEDVGAVHLYDRATYPGSPDANGRIPKLFIEHTVLAGQGVSSPSFMWNLPFPGQPFLFAGAQPASLPLGGGHLLEIAPPWILLGPFVVSPSSDGSYANANLPLPLSSIPPGLVVYLQTLVTDSSTPTGIKATTASARIESQ